MGLVSMRDLLLDAMERHYAIAGFNVQNMEMVQAVVAAAVDERSPVIVQFNPGNLRHVGMAYGAALVRVAAEQADVPVVLHLDHGADFAQAVAAVRQGFTSIMYDGTMHSLEQNAEVTRLVCQVAHAVGVSVEGEIGQMGGKEEGVFTAEGLGTMTDPAAAQHYAESTGIDALAIAVGNVHGLQAATATLDMARISAVRERVALPLVIHGGSGVPDDTVREAIARGVCKFNVATQLNQGFVEGLRTVMAANPNESNPRAALEQARELVKEAARAKIRLFWSSGRA